MHARGQSAAEILVGAIFLMIVYVTISGVVIDQRRLSADTLESQLEYAYCSSVAEKMDLTAERKLAAYFVRAEFDTTISDRHVRVGESVCPYTSSLKKVDVACSDPRTYSFVRGQPFIINYYPGSCGNENYDLVILQGDFSCGNGVGELGESCGEPGRSCPNATDYDCEYCVCVPKGPDALQGCLLAGTLVDTPRGKVPVESLSIGDAVFALDGPQQTMSTVRGVEKVKRNAFFEVEAGGLSIRTTAEHPFWTGTGFVEAENLSPGDTVMMRADDRLVAQNVDRVTRFDVPVVAYNVELAGPHVFLAGGFAVHNGTEFDPMGGNGGEAESEGGGPIAPDGPPGPDSFVISEKTFSIWGLPNYG